MSPHLTEIEKIEQLLENENFNLDSLNDFSIEEKQDILLQKQLVEEITNLQILEELEEIHNRKAIKTNTFKKRIYLLFALLFLFSSIGIYFVTDFIFNPKNEIYSENSIQNEIELVQNTDLENTELIENSTSQKNDKSGLSWNKNQVIDTLKDASKNFITLEKAKIKRVLIIDTLNKDKNYNYGHNMYFTTSIESNEIIVCNDNSVFYIEPVSYDYMDSLYTAWDSKITPSHKYNGAISDPQFDYHIKGEEIKIVNPDGKNKITSPSLSADGNTLYYSKKSKKGDYDIWKTERILQDGKLTWQEPTEVKALNQLKSYELSPSISADGNTIYFSRNPNAVGCARIYFSTKNEFGEWNKPQMIPISDNKHINYGCDVAPYILPDGKTLLFSAQRTGDGTGTTVKNLGLYDIYMTQKQENGKWSQMELIESISSESTESHFTVLPKENKIYFSRISNHCAACNNIQHSIPIPKQLQAFFPQKEKANLISQKNKLIETSTGKDFELNDFTFDSNSALLTQNGKESLERILLFLDENPAISLQIIAHTDNEGEMSYNQILSEKRAKAVCQFLESKGIDKKRLLPLGKGEKEPKVENINQENKAKNRRVEFFVVDRIN